MKNTRYLLSYIFHFILILYKFNVMKKSFLPFLLIYIFTINIYAQWDSDCFFSADSEVCATRNAILDNPNEYYAVYQYDVSTHCILLKWNFPFCGTNDVAGLSIWIIPGIGSSTLPQMVFNAEYCTNAPPYGPNTSLHIENDIVFTNLDKVVYYISQTDSGMCSYDAKSYQEYFGYSISFPCSGSAPNEDNMSQNRLNSNMLLTYNMFSNIIEISADQKFNNIEIVNLNGRLMKKMNGEEKYFHEFDLSFLKSGFYIVRVTTIDNNIKNFKIIKN
jgi:hypothetical protein